MDYLIFLTKVVGKNLIYNPSIVRLLLFDVYADHVCSTPCLWFNLLFFSPKDKRLHRARHTPGSLNWVKGQGYENKTKSSEPKKVMFSLYNHGNFS